MWEIIKPMDSADFLDLALSIKGNKIKTKTFQKAINLYLYLSPNYAHLLSCIKGPIFCLIHCYHAQNTHRSDFPYFVTLLYRQLMDQVWEQGYVYGLIIKAAEQIESVSTSQSSGDVPLMDDLL